MEYSIQQIYNRPQKIQYVKDETQIELPPFIPSDLCGISFILTTADMELNNLELITAELYDESGKIESKLKKMDVSVDSLLNPNYIQITQSENRFESKKLHMKLKLKNKIKEAKIIKITYHYAVYENLTSGYFSDPNPYRNVMNFP